MLKKTYLCSAYNGLQSCSICSPRPSGGFTSNTSPHHLPVQRARPQHNSNKRQRFTEPPSRPSARSYATVRDRKNGPDFRDSMNWPCGNENSPNPFVPSPYEIFDMQRGAKYGKLTKLKYFELVKIYHPDRSIVNNGCGGLSQGDRLERYRLIVLAHEILSDPEKRRAYDSYGAGWASKQSATRYSRGYSSTTGQQYGQGPGYDNSPFANATWEDWERWYRRNADDSQKQAYAGTFVNPNAFAAFVIMVAVLSGILQATRASTFSGNIAEKQLALTEETSRFMMARATHLEEEKLDSGGRVKAFLEKRDPTRYGLKEEEEEQYRRHFASDEEITPLGRRKEKIPEGQDVRGVDVTRDDTGRLRAKVSYT